MKKISIVLNICFLGIIIFFGCEKETGRSAATDCVERRSYDRTYFSANTITYPMARQLANDYHRLNLPALSTPSSLPITIRPTGGDARTVWYPLDILKAYLYSIENQVCKSSCATSKLELGVRIYFGRYPATIPPGYRVEPGYANRHTLFMVPTYQDASTGNNIDFDPWLLKEGVACNLTYDTSSQNQPILAPSGTAFNHGDLIPPRLPYGLSFYSF